MLGASDCSAKRARKPSAENEKRKRSQFSKDPTACFFLPLLFLARNVPIYPPVPTKISRMKRTHSSAFPTGATSLVEVRGGSTSESTSSTAETAPSAGPTRLYTSTDDKQTLSSMLLVELRAIAKVRGLRLKKARNVLVQSILDHDVAVAASAVPTPSIQNASSSSSTGLRRFTESDVKELEKLTNRALGLLVQKRGLKQAKTKGDLLRSILECDLAFIKARCEQADKPKKRQRVEDRHVRFGPVIATLINQGAPVTYRCTSGEQERPPAESHFDYIRYLIKDMGFGALKRYAAAMGVDVKKSRTIERLKAEVLAATKSAHLRYNAPVKGVDRSYICALSGKICNGEPEAVMIASQEGYCLTRRTCASEPLRLQSLVKKPKSRNRKVIFDNADGCGSFDEELNGEFFKAEPEGKNRQIPAPSNGHARKRKMTSPAPSTVKKARH
ncbi:hypothetical protein DFJ73DRAFT_916164 [Zopfochytrium polystomum]|nr:hypothetical protein DFJ73DRAFT_916164 [Zopfochytrium polystomum]